MLADLPPAKSAPPKVHIAAAMKRVASVSNRWLAVRLQMGRHRSARAKTRKSEPWQLSLAAAMKQQTTATNRCLSEHLHMGNLCEVGRKANAWMLEPDPLFARQLSLTPNPKG